jgi:hypothetical protein
MTACYCGHRLGIHEYPYACKGIDGNLPDAGRCPCFRYYAWDAIKSDRDAIEQERAA